MVREASARGRGGRAVVEFEPRAPATNKMIPTVWIEIPAIVASTASQRTSPNATRARGGPAYLAGDEVNDRLRVQFEAILVKRPLDLPEP